MHNLIISSRTMFIMMLFVFGACSAVNPPGDGQTTQDDPINQITYGLTLEVSGIDPHINQSSELGIVLRQVYDTLVYRDPITKALVPGLATEWNVSQDGLIYTFKLRQDVSFHDGTPFNAQAVAANIDRIFHPDTNSQKARFLLGPFSNYEIVDDFTIRLFLQEPYSPLLDGLSQVYLGIASPAALEEYSLLRYQLHQVGSGPFLFEEYLPGDRIVLRRNPDYAWGPPFYQAVQDTAVTVIEFRFFTDAATRSIALESNDAQIMGELLPTDARTLSGNSKFQLLPAMIPGQPLQFYMNTLLPPLDSLAIRQALLYATNRVAIVDAVFQGTSPVAWGPISAETLYYHNGLVGVYANDVGQAQSLLSSAGYADTDDDGLLDKDGSVLEVKIVVPPWGQIPDVAQLIQDQWRAIGIRAILDPVPSFAALRERVSSGDYHLVAFNSAGLDPSLLNIPFLSDSIDNWTGFGSIELDNILREATRQSDPEIRRQLYAQAQTVIMEQALILPIRDRVNLNAYTASISGLTFDPYGWFPLMHNVSKVMQANE